MVGHSAEYPWSSNRGNALGDKRLNRALVERQRDEKTREEVKASINKAGVPGSEYFRNIITTQLNRRASPLPKGSDRKSGRKP